MKKVNYSFTALLEILSDETPEKLLAHTRQLLRYYQDGYDHYRKHISADDAFDHADTLTWLTDLERLASAFLDVDTDISLILRRGSVRINVHPLTDFFYKHSIDSCMTTITGINSALVAYIHSDNHTDFKLAFHTLSRWKYIFHELTGEPVAL